MQSQNKTQVYFLIFSLLLLLAVNFIHHYVASADDLDQVYITIDGEDFNWNGGTADFGKVKFWRFFLPMNYSGHSHLEPTGRLLIEYLKTVFDAEYRSVSCFFSALLITVVFLSSWHIFRSFVFSYTVSVCMIFGPQFLLARQGAAGGYIYPFVTYLSLTLFCMYKSIFDGNSIAFWRASFFLSLLAFALSFVTWLNILVFLGLCFAYGFFLSYRKGLSEIRYRLKYIALLSSIVLLIWAGLRSQGVFEVPIKQRDEDSLIFTYILKGDGTGRQKLGRLSPQYSILVVDDFVSNVIKYIHTSLTNYLPATFTYPGSLTIFSREEIEHDHWNHSLPYKEKGNFDFLYGHYLFSWYLYAGIVFSVFCFYTCRFVAKSIRIPSQFNVSVTIFFILIWTGFACHALIKFRPYMSVPLFPHKCVISVFGVALLVAYLLMTAKRRMGSQRLATGIIYFSWFIIMYSGLTKPKIFSNLGSFAVFPDFFTQLSKLLN